MSYFDYLASRTPLLRPQAQQPPPPTPGPGNQLAAAIIAQAIVNQRKAQPVQGPYPVQGPPTPVQVTPGAAGATTGFNQGAYNALFNAAYNQSHGVPQLLPDGPETIRPVVGNAPDATGAGGIGGSTTGPSSYTPPPPPYYDVGGAPGENRGQLAPPPIEQPYMGPQLGPMSGTYNGEPLPADDVMNAPADPNDPTGLSVENSLRLIPGAGAVIDAAKYGVNKFDQLDEYSRTKVQSGIAFGIVQYVKRMRDSGMPDYLIMQTMQNNPMFNIIIPKDAHNDETEFFDGLIKAYDEGYTAYKTLAYDPNAKTPNSEPISQVPVESWEPGSRSAHEYMAGWRNTAERATNDLLEAPLNWALGPFRGAGEKLAVKGAEMTAAGYAERSAAKVATGKVLEGTGKVAAVPDIVLNQVADEGFKVAGQITGDVLSAIPGVRNVASKLAEVPTRVKGRIGKEQSVDALNIADSMESAPTSGVVEEPPPPPVVPDEPPPIDPITGAPVGTQLTDLPNTPTPTKPTIKGGDVGVEEGPIRTVPEQPRTREQAVQDEYDRMLADSQEQAARVGETVDTTQAPTPKRTKPWTAVEIKQTEGVTQRDAARLRDERNAVIKNPPAEPTPTPDVPVQQELTVAVKKTPSGFELKDAKLPNDHPSVDRYTVETSGGTYQISGAPGAGRYPYKAWNGQNLIAEGVNLESLLGQFDSAMKRIGNVPVSTSVPIPQKPITNWSLNKEGGRIQVAQERYPVEFSKAQPELESVANEYEIAVDKKRGTQLPNTALIPGSGVKHGYADDAIYGAEFYADTTDILNKHGIPARELPNITAEGKNTNSVERAVKRAIYSDTEEESNAALRELYSAGYISAEIPSPTLRDDIINATIPGDGKATARFSNGNFVSYDNASLQNMPMAGREQFADLAVADAMRKYERLSRINAARTRLVDRYTVGIPELDPVTDAAKQGIITDVEAQLASGAPTMPHDDLVQARRVAQEATSLDDAIERLDNIVAQNATEPRIALVERLKAYFREMWAKHGQVHFIHPTLRKTMGKVELTDLPEPPGPKVYRDPNDVYLPEDIRKTVDETKFAGLSEPLYAGWNLRRVRDELLGRIVPDQIEYNELARQVANDKTALGLSQEPLYKKGGKADAKRPVVSATREGPVKKGRPPVKELTGQEIIAKERRMAAILDTWGRHGDIAIDDPRKIANEAAAYQKELDINPNLAKRPTTTMGKAGELGLDFLDAVINRVPRHLLLADPITSWGYTGRNIMGNVSTAALGSQGESLGRVVESFRPVLNQDYTPLGVRISEDMGLVLPREFERKTATANDIMTRRGLDTPVGQIGSNTPTRELVRKLHLDWVPRKFDAKRSVDAGFEYAGKMEMAYSPIFQHLANEGTSNLATDLARVAKNRGLDISAGEYMDMLFDLRKADTGVFSYTDAAKMAHASAIERGATNEVANTMAEVAERKWKDYGRKAQLGAIDKTNHRFPSIRNMTNLDQYLTYITLFHLWPTRTFKLVIEEMIRNPTLYTTWQRTHDGLARMAEEGGYPDSVKMLMYIAESPLGFALYANPASLFLVTALQPEQQAVPDPEGMTKLGHYLKEFKRKTGLGPTPFIDSMLNVIGVYGNAYPPNPWPSRTAELAGAAIDVGLTQLGHGFGTPVYDNAMAWVRSVGSGHIPGTSNVPYTDQGAYTEDLVGSVILENNPDLKARMSAVEMGPNGYYQPTADALDAQKEFAAIVEDGNNPENVKAMKIVALNKAFTNAFNDLSPVLVKSKLNSREVMIQASREGREAETPTEVQAGAKQVRGTVTSTPESIKLDAAADEYQQIGTPRQQELHDAYIGILHPEDTPNWYIIEINGTTYTAGQLKAMPEEDRRTLAEYVIADADGTEELDAYFDEREAFVKENPEFGSANDWRSTAYDYEGGVSQFRKDRAAGNPNFKAEMESYETYLEGQGMSPQMVQKSLDQWAAGVSGYKAAHGVQSSIYDPVPKGTGDQATVDSLLKSMPEGGGSGGGTSSKKSVAQKLSADIVSYNRDMGLVKGVMSSYGLTEDAFDSGNPYMQDTLSRLLGDMMPTETTLMKQYALWRQAQPAGYDTSIEAFGRWWEAEEQKLAA